MKKTFFIILTQLLFVMGLQAQTQQELRDSLSMIEGLIAEHPKAVKLYLRKAALHIELGQWERALDDYNAVVDMMPYNLTALYYRGFVNQHLKRYAFARKDFETVLMIEPQNKHAMMGVISTNMLDGRAVEAYDMSNTLVEKYPSEAVSYAMRSEVEESLGMTNAAIDDIEKAISMEKTVAEKKFPFSDGDDMVGYQLSAFSLYMQNGEKLKARQCLEYLERNGLSRMQLTDYYAKLKEK